MNKNGWGLRAELLFILLFVVCLIISTLGLYEFGLVGNENDKLGLHVDSYEYRALENKVRDAASSYYKRMYPGGTDSIIVTVSSLKGNGYLTSLEDPNGSECTGYAKILSNGTSVPYIRCKAYKTEGYDRSNE